MISIDMEMPKSCSDCKLKTTNLHWQSIWRYSCKITNLEESCSYAQGNYQDKFYTQRHRKCPLQEPQLDSDIEELMKDIHKSSKFACENTTADGVPHVDYSIAVLNVIDDELYDSIKQALVDKEKAIKTYRNLYTKSADKVVDIGRERNKLQAKLNKIEEVIKPYDKVSLINGLGYKEIDDILKEDDNETV